MSGAFTAAVTYGTPPLRQPTPNAAGTPGAPQPMARTEARPTGSLNNPVLLLVVLLGLAIWLINFSVGFSFSVKR